MKLNAILEIVHQAYPDEHTRRCWNTKKQKPQTGTGDTLAEFIVREIVDTFDVDAGDTNQIDAALCAMRWAAGSRISQIYIFTRIPRMAGQLFRQGSAATAR